MRKRKAKGVPAPAPLPPRTSSRLEEKLDDLVSLLRSQAVNLQAEKQSHKSQLTPSTVNGEDNTPPSSTGSYPVEALTPAPDPDIVLDTSANIVELTRPAKPDPAPSPVLHDVSVHYVPDVAAEDTLARFHAYFLPVFPLAYIPAGMKASELRQQKPFLWLVIMAIATTRVSQQFEMEETIWNVICKRIVTQHLADLDLLLGVIAFASWYGPLEKLIL